MSFLFFIFISGLLRVSLQYKYYTFNELSFQNILLSGINKRKIQLLNITSLLSMWMEFLSTNYVSKYGTRL